MKKILVPMDFTYISKNALHHASILAKAFKSTIYIINVLPIPYTYISTMDSESYKVAYTEFKELFRKQKINMIDSLRSLKNLRFLEGVRIITKLSIGNSIYREILRYAESNKFDLIVMGSKSPTSIGKKIIGTNAERILRFTKIPVLIVTDRTKLQRFKKIVFPSNFEKDSLKIYPKINSFAKEFDSHVQLLYVNTKSEFETTKLIYDRMNRFRKRFKGDFVNVIRAAKDIETGIVTYARNSNADMIAIGVRRRKGLSRYFTDRITEGVIRHTKIPVLAIDNPK